MAKQKYSGSGALALLRADHEKVLALFGQFDALRGSDDDDERKAELVGEICYELTLHTMIEEEIFYPLLRVAIDEDALMDEADVEHTGARELVSQLEVMFPGDDHYDATVTVLGEQIAHHIEKEEDILFAAAREAGLDLDDIGELLLARKAELDEDLTAPAPVTEAMQVHESTRRPPRPPN